MKEPRPVTLEGHGVRLEPMAPGHRDALAKAAADGRLWELWFTSVPEPQQTEAYIAQALAGRDAGHMLPWVVRELASGEIAGSTRYHDIIKDASRVEIGWTWYAARWQQRASSSPSSSSSISACPISTAVRWQKTCEACPAARAR